MNTFSKRKAAVARDVGVALYGTLLIAATYGMARFGVGLFSPRIGREHPELAGVLGYAAAAQFIAYSVAATVAARVSDRRPRVGLMLAGATATIGCLGVAVAATPGVFVASVFVGGLGAGFASPAMVRVIDSVTRDASSATVQSMVNSGTAVGVVGAGSLAVATSSLAPVWVFMAAICLMSMIGVLHVADGRNDTRTPPCCEGPATGVAVTSSRTLLLPAVAAVVVGAGSALVWTFGPTLLTEYGTVTEQQTGLLWVALGLGGLVGPWTGVVFRKVGSRGGWRLFAAATAVASALLGVAISEDSNVLAFGAMVVFGVGYMGLTGTLILVARVARPDAAGVGTAVLFVALAVGQAFGSFAFGLAVPSTGPVLTAAVAMGLCALGAALASKPAPKPTEGPLRSDRSTDGALQ
ncbi:MAG: MFS transporter [Rhodococcus sp. (in: high G+C Gram-positive bacteria)]